ncbi:MAG: alpha/beta fold hydrolase [Salinisphaeraceae bacterium]
MMKWLGRGLALLVGAVIAALVFLYVVSPQTAYRLALTLERGNAGLDISQVSLGDVNLPVLEGGSGPPLLLIHGFGGDKDNWTRLAGELTDHFRVIAPDLPPFGGAPTDPDRGYGYAAQVDRIHQLVQAMDLSLVHVGGNSMGGAIAGAYAAAHPETVRSLWLLAPSGLVDAPPSELDEHVAAGGENPLLPATRSEYFELMDWLFHERPYIPAPVQWVLAQQAVAQRDRRSTVLEQIRADPLDLAAALDGVGVPTLITWGENDRLLAVGGARILDQALPDSQLHLMPATGHVPMIERPAATATAFREFAQGLEQR